MRIVNIARSSTFMLALISLMGSLTLMWPSSVGAQTPAAGWSYTGSLNTGRTWHTATRLSNGKVLIAGGGGGGSLEYWFGGYSYSAELYDPVSGTWSYTGGLRERRGSHSATLLQNGQVLVAGGMYNPGSPPYQAYLQTAELYDPVSGSWRRTGSFVAISGFNSAILLPNGNVLAIGPSNPLGPIDSAELYDPATGKWSSTDVPATFGPMTLLPNGKVLDLSGSYGGLYDPATERWTSVGGLSVIRFVSSATLLQSGKILVTGAENRDGNPVEAELYDPSTETSTPTGNLKTPGGGKITLLSDGRVLMAGGYDELLYYSGNSAELYEPVTETWSLTSSLHVGRQGHTATPLSDGKVLVAGGNNGDFDWLTIFGSAELYTPESNSTPNPIDDSEFFVRQHYQDFLNRESDAAGLAFWVNEITSCGGDQRCIEVKRIKDSGSFFLSIEFQETGYLAYRMYKTAFGNLPNAPIPITFIEFVPDTQAIGRNVIVNQPGWAQVLENNKQIFTAQFVERPRFTEAFTPAMSAQEFVDKLNSNAGSPLSQTERDQLVSDLSGGQRSRADVLRAIAENPKLAQAEFNRAFVLMQYFGYLRRNPDDAPDSNFVGYNTWLDKLNSLNGDFIQAEMVKAFISSTEYRKRFGS